MPTGAGNSLRLGRQPLKLPPDMHLGEVGVAVNSKGHSCYRGGSPAGLRQHRPQILEFDRNGGSCARSARELYAWAYAHTVRVDKDDNIWATTRARTWSSSSTQAASRWCSDAAERPTRGATVGANPTRRCARGRPSASRPTSPGTPQGNIYISDGYVNSRVAKYDKNGDWVKSWGRGQGPGEFNPGTASPSTRRARSMSATATTGASRCSTATATSSASQDRRAVRRERETGDRQQPDLTNYLQTGGSFAPGAPGALHHAGAEPCSTAPIYPGRVYKLSLEGRCWAISAARASSPSSSMDHEIACPSENELYVAEILNWRVQKLMLQPDRQRRQWSSEIGPATQ